MVERAVLPAWHELGCRGEPMRSRHVRPACLALLLAGCGARTPLDDFAPLEDAGEGLPDAPSSSLPDAAGSDASLDAGVPDAAVCEGVIPGAGSCNALAVSGPWVTVECASGSAPAPAGGTITQGVYVLVSSTFYGGCPRDGEQDRIVWSLCAESTWATAQESRYMGALQSDQINVTVERQGTQLKVTPICGPSGTPVETFGYDAKAGTLTLHVDYGGGSVRVDRFNRQ